LDTIAPAIANAINIFPTITAVSSPEHACLICNYKPITVRAEIPPLGKLWRRIRFGEANDTPGNHAQAKRKRNRGERTSLGIPPLPDAK